MRWPAPFVGPQRNRDFSCSRSRFGRFDHELGCKFHSAGPKPETIVKIRGESSHSAIHIPNSGAEKQVHDGGHDWCTDITMMPGHRAILDLSGEAIAHY